MAARNRQPPPYCIDFSVLKEKYHPHRNKGPSRIRTYCKDIERYTKARIQVDIPQRLDRDRKDVRFEIQGKNDAVQKAIEHIQGEFILRKKMPNASQDLTPTGVPLPRLNFPGHSGPRKAAKVLDKSSRTKLAQADPATPHLLTTEALKKHDIATGTCELRQFACAPCDNVWWRVVSTYKPVSRCKKCRIRYDALQRELEFGIGLFTCGCGNDFKSKCTAQTTCPCYNCNAPVSKPFIHPKFNRTAKPTSHRKHYCDKCHGMGRCPTFKFKRVIYPSKPHNSTGSTVSTYLSQPDFTRNDAPYFRFRGDGSLADDQASTATYFSQPDDNPYFYFGEDDSLADDLASMSLEDNCSGSD